MTPKTSEEERTELIQRISNMTETQWAWFIAEARKVLAQYLRNEIE